MFVLNRAAYDVLLDVLDFLHWIFIAFFHCDANWLSRSHKSIGNCSHNLDIYSGRRRS